MTDTDNLFGEFDTVKTENWIKAIEKFLKGKTKDSLDIEIEEGLCISPLQRYEDSSFSQLTDKNATTNNNWKICELINAGKESEFDYKRSNTNMLKALERGVNSLIIDLSSLPTKEELTILFEGVYIELIDLHFRGPGIEASPLNFLKNLAESQDSKKICGSCDLGNISDKDLLESVNFSLDVFTDFRLINISIENSGTDNLCKSLNEVSNKIDLLLKEGKKIEQIANCFRFEYNVGFDYFVEIATLRAIPKLWFGILQAYNSQKAIPVYIHSSTLIDKNKDKYKNMIAATTQTMSAAIAGSDSIYISPSDSSEKSKEFTERIAVNVQHILQSESYLNRVSDPAAGSYYLEKLTSLITEKAWQQFCCI
jgi:methylmalonyl-CoA mutase